MAKFKVETKFRVGDRVEIDLDYNKYLNYYKGTIDEITNSGLINLITDKGSYAPYYKEKELKHLKIRNTKIARKMYPHYEEDGDWLICKSKRTT